MSTEMLLPIIVSLLKLSLMYVCACVCVCKSELTYDVIIIEPITCSIIDKEEQSKRLCHQMVNGCFVIVILVVAMRYLLFLLLNHFECKHPLIVVVL